MLIKKITVATFVLLAGCSVGPDYVKPQTDVGKEFISAESQNSSQEEIDYKWWEMFNDPVLNELIEQAMQNNHDIKIAIANIESARALRNADIGKFFPEVTASESASRDYLSRKTSTVRKRDLVGAELDASWELDVFGKVRRSVEASQATLEAKTEEKNGVLLSVLAEVARNYFEMRGLQRHIEVTERNVKLLKEIENLARSQFKTGVVTEFDFSRAKGERQSVEALLPNLKAEMTADIYRISVLTGQKPEFYTEKLKKIQPLPVTPALFPVGLRSDILRNRPDIRQAERHLAAATAEIGVSTAEMFPSISLSGVVGTSARVMGDLFTTGSSVYGVGQSVTAPIFKAGQLRAQVQASKAEAKAALASYDKTVLSALEEAESSLARYSGEWETLKQLKDAENTRKEGFKIAKLRYEAGEENFLTILDAERTLITTQDSVIGSETKILTDLTQLYKALGGGWQTFSADAAKKGKEGKTKPVVPVKKPEALEARDKPEADKPEQNEGAESDSIKL